MIVDALPLRPGLRVLEIGCGPGAMARAIAARIGDGHVLAIDRSAKAIVQAAASSQADIASGRLSLRCIAVEEFELGLGEAPYDIAVAVQVGALDGRHPEAGERARRRIAAAGRGHHDHRVGERAPPDTEIGRREQECAGMRRADVMSALTDRGPSLDRPGSSN